MCEQVCPCYLCLILGSIPYVGLFCQVLLLSLRNFFFFFLMEDRKGVSLDERGGREQLEGVERGKCNQDILCGKKKQT